MDLNELFQFMEDVKQEIENIKADRDYYKKELHDLRLEYDKLWRDQHARNQTST